MGGKRGDGKGKHTRRGMGDGDAHKGHRGMGEGDARRGRRAMGDDAEGEGWKSLRGISSNRWCAQAGTEDTA